VKTPGILEAALYVADINRSETFYLRVLNLHKLGNDLVREGIVPALFRDLSAMRLAVESWVIER